MIVPSSTVKSTDGMGLRSAALIVAFLFSFIPHVAAHGYLKSVAIDGQTYQGNVPNNPSGAYCGVVLVVCSRI